MNLFLVVYRFYVCPPYYMPFFGRCWCDCSTVEWHDTTSSRATPKRWGRSEAGDELQSFLAQVTEDLCKKKKRYSPPNIAICWCCASRLQNASLVYMTAVPQIYNVDNRFQGMAYLTNLWAIGPASKTSIVTYSRWCPIYMQGVEIALNTIISEMEGRGKGRICISCMSTLTSFHTVFDSHFTRGW